MATVNVAFDEAFQRLRDAELLYRKAESDIEDFAKERYELHAKLAELQVRETAGEERLVEVGQLVKKCEEDVADSYDKLKAQENKCTKRYWDWVTPSHVDMKNDKVSIEENGDLMEAKLAILGPKVVFVAGNDVFKSPQALHTAFLQRETPNNPVPLGICGRSSKGWEKIRVEKNGISLSLNEYYDLIMN